MSVKPRGRSWQISVTHKGARVRHQVPMDTHTQAQADDLEMEILLSLRRHGRWPVEGEKSLSPKHAKQKGTLEAGLEKAMRHWRSDTDSGRQAISRCRRFVSFMGASTLLDDVTTDDCERYVTFLLEEEDNLPSSVRIAWSAVSVMYDLCRDSTPPLCKTKPKVSLPKGSRKRNRALTREEEMSAIAFYRRIGDLDMIDILGLGVSQGLRVGEILALRCQNFTGLTDPAGKPQVWPTDTLRRPSRPSKAEKEGLKTQGSSVPLPLTKRAREIALRRSAALDFQPRRRLFEGWDYDRVMDQWNKMRDALGLLEDRHFTFHCTRHATATRLIEMNVNLIDVQQFMRHADISTTEGYVVSDHSRLGLVAAAIDTGRYVPAVFQPGVPGDVTHVADLMDTSGTFDAEKAQ